MNERNYYENGIRIFWLDEAEPEFTGYEYEQHILASTRLLVLDIISMELFTRCVLVVCM